MERWDAQLDVVLPNAGDEQAVRLAGVLGGRPERAGPDVRINGSVVLDAHDPGAAVTEALRSVNARVRAADPDWRHQVLIEVTIRPHWPGEATG